MPAKGGFEEQGPAGRLSANDERTLTVTEAVEDAARMILVGLMPAEKVTDRPFRRRRSARLPNGATIVPLFPQDAARN